MKALPSTGKISSLQILRGFAAWMVVYHHFMQAYFDFSADSWLGHFFSKYGGFGVDLFFVLSGFVMFNAVKNGDGNAEKFAINRLFRIAPVYWFYTFLIVICIHIFPDTFRFTSYNLKTLLASLLFIPTDNPSGIGVFPVLTVGWTLNFEMFFYFVLSCSLLSGKSRALWICFFAIFSMPLLYSEGLPLGRVVASHLLYEFLIGFIIAYVFLAESTEGLIEKYRAPVVIGGLSVGVVAIALMNEYRILKFLAAGSLVSSAIVFDPWVRKDFSIVKGLVRLGDESYSTYLAHGIIIFSLMHYTGKNLSETQEILIILLVTFLVLIASRLSYQFVEHNKYLENLRIRAIACVRGKGASQGEWH